MSRSLKHLREMIIMGTMFAVALTALGTLIALSGLTRPDGAVAALPMMVMVVIHSAPSLLRDCALLS